MGRRDECPECGLDARVCFNCRFHDRSAYRECREEQAEWVKEKNAGNFCGFFDASANSRGTSNEDQAVRAKLDKLFGGGGVPSESAEASDVKKPTASLQDELAKFLNSKK
jgi:hypothetical protein